MSGARPAGDWPELMTAAEVAAQFRVHRATVRRWAADGTLPSVKSPGGHNRFPAAAVRALLDATTARTSP